MEAERAVPKGGETWRVHCERKGDFVIKLKDDFVYGSKYSSAVEGVLVAPAYIESGGVRWQAGERIGTIVTICTFIGKVEIMGREQRYDVVSVGIDTNEIVQIISTSRDRPSAEAVINWAVLNRGVETHFYTAVPTGSHAVGEKLRGDF